MSIMRLAGMLFLLVSLMIGTGAGAAKKAVAARESQPDVLVVVFSQADGAIDQVSFTFPAKVDHGIAKAYMQRLVKETGWQCLNPSISDEGSMQSGSSVPMTSVAFGTRFAVLRADSNLLVAPIARTFRDKKRVLIYYMVAPPFDYRGMKGTFSDPNVRIDFSQQGTTYIYDVNLKRHDFTALALPATAPPGVGATAATGQPAAGKNSPLAMVGLIVAALAAAVIAYIAAGKYLGSARG